MGALTPIGNGQTEFLAGLENGRDGVGPIAGFDVSRHRVQRAAEVRWAKPASSPYSRASEMALAAMGEALANAKLGPEQRDPARLGVVLASNQGGMASFSERYRELTFPYRRGPVDQGRTSRVMDSSPISTLDLLMANAGAHGPAYNISTACSAGLHALGMAFDAIRNQEVDVVLVAGVEVLTEPALAGFAVLRALASGDSLCPFDCRRDGTLLGEGAAVLVVENAEHARARGIEPWAEVAGYGSSTDAFHMTRPQMEGPARAMTEALGHLPPEEVDWIKAHGTGTPANDVAEAQAIRSVFLRHQRVPVTSIKSMIGHSLGASGVVESVATILAMKGGFVPQTLHLENLDPECDLDVVSGQPRANRGKAVLANAFGFGGNNAAILFRAI